MDKIRLVPTAETADRRMTASAYVPGDAVTHGAPRERELAHLSSADERFTVGVWSAEPYAERVNSFDGYEYTVVLQGRVTLTHTDGTQHTFGPGDAFTIEPGWSGEYRVDEPLMKHFVYYAEVSA